MTKSWDIIHEIQNRYKPQKTTYIKRSEAISNYILIAIIFFTLGGICTIITNY